jgi:hypothetical protein
MFVLGLAVPNFTEGYNKKKEESFYYFHIVALGLISWEATSTRTIIGGKYF